MLVASWKASVGRRKYVQWIYLTSRLLNIGLALEFCLQFPWSQIDFQKSTYAITSLFLRYVCKLHWYYGKLHCNRSSNWQEMMFISLSAWSGYITVNARSLLNTIIYESGLVKTRNKLLNASIPGFYRTFSVIFTDYFW